MTPYADQRKNHILDRLLTSGRVDAVEVAESLGVTGETIRKDLIALERQGLLRRVHGGALPVQSPTFEPSVETRTQLASEKTRIAQAALNHLPAEGSVLIDAGSTTAKLVELFPGDRDLTVYTNTVPLAMSLLTRPRLTVFTLGGRLRNVTFAEVGDWAARALAEINVDVAFLGTNGISIERGLTTPDPAEAAVKRLMLGCASKRVLLADHSKFGVVKGTKHGDLDDIDVLISDTGLTDGQYRAIAQRRSRSGASMIVTLTPNPSVDRTVFVDDVVLGSVNRSRRSRSEPSGKGVNVALALHAHDVAVRAVVTAGGSGRRAVAADARRRGAGHRRRSHRRRDPQQHQPDPAERHRHQDQRGGPAAERRRSRPLLAAVASHIRGAELAGVRGQPARGVPGRLVRRSGRDRRRNGVPVAVDTSGDALAESLCRTGSGEAECARARRTDRPGAADPRRRRRRRTGGTPSRRRYGAGQPRGRRRDPRRCRPAPCGATRLSTGW